MRVERKLRAKLLMTWKRVLRPSSVELVVWCLR